MEQLNDISAIIALTMGVAWASGINLYATIAMLGYLGITGNIDLPEGLMILQDPLVIGAAGFMYCVEFFADKTPGVDTGWDAMHTFIRIPAGAMLAAGAMLTEGKVMEPRTLWAGRPAKPMKELTDAAIAGMRMGVAHYAENAKHHAEAVSEALG